jgi:hypothetical protein
MASLLMKVCKSVEMVEGGGKNGFPLSMGFVLLA